MVWAAAAAAAVAVIWGPGGPPGGAEPMATTFPAFPWARARTDAQAVANDWAGKHRELKALAAQMDAAGTRADWVLMGDSITAYFRAMGKAAQHFPGQKVFVAGLGGDVLSSLAWRVADDGVPRLPPRAARVLIGTNDLPPWSSVTPEVLAARTAEFVGALRARWPGTPVLVQLLFDRAKYGDAVRRTNELLRARLAGAGAFEGVHVVDCGTPGASADDGTGTGATGTGATGALVPWSKQMPDGLHPSDEGQARVLACTRARFPALFEPTGPSTVWPLVTTRWTPPAKKTTTAPNAPAV